MKESDEKVLHNLLKETRNPHRIAEIMSKTVSEIRNYMKKTELDYLLGWGRVEIQKDIISRRSIHDRDWSDEDKPIIEKYRELHDAGNVSLCHGRDGKYILLYSQYSNPPVKNRRPYFKGIT